MSIFEKTDVNQLTLTSVLRRTNVDEVTLFMIMPLHFGLHRFSI